MKALQLVVTLLISPSLDGIGSSQACAGPEDLGTFGGTYSAALAVSADGEVVVGGSRSNSTGPMAAFIWTKVTGLQPLGIDQAARAISSDGTTVVGGGRGTSVVPRVDNTNSAAMDRAFRWTASAGIQQLGSLGQGSAIAYDVSADGATVVGRSWAFANPIRTHAFVWTPQSGIQGLGTMPGTDNSAAYGVSADGTVVVGVSRNGLGTTMIAFRWTAATGMQDLGSLGGTRSEAFAVSDDGSVVVGSSQASNGEIHAFRWTANTGMQRLDTLGLAPSEALAVSGDGLVAVGYSNSTAVRWSGPNGVQPLLTLQGALGKATGVASDGTVVVGQSDPSPPKAFRAQLSILGGSYCRPHVPNSTGCGGVCLADGFPLVFLGNLELTATLLPQNAFGFFLASQAQGFASGIPSNQGNICVSGNIGRFVGPGQVMNSGVGGAFTLSVDLAQMPTPTGLVAVQPGDTWNFQAWYRDANPGPTSNFTDAVSVTFQ